MKNLYPKGKGKIHPSPSPSSPYAVDSALTGGSPLPRHEVVAGLELLPAAILALTVALGLDDLEVLAYLLTQSVRGPGAALGGGSGGTADVPGGDGKRRHRSAAGGAHQPSFDCGCFDCYTSFWSRWDCSPDRELIHQVIEAFEDHLARSEKVLGSRNRRKERKTMAAESREKGEKKGKEKARKKNSSSAKPSVFPLEKGKDAQEPPEMADKEKLSPVATERRAVLVGIEEQWEEVGPMAAEIEVEPATEEAATGERRRGWLDAMDLFNFRLWSL